MKADHTSQLQFEEIHDKNQLMKRLKSEYANDIVQNICDEHQIPFDFAVALLSQMSLHKRASVSVLVGILYVHFEEEEYVLQACADMILKAIQANLINYSEMSNVCIIRLDLSQDVYDDLDRYQFPLPMLIPPVTVTNNKQSGYLKVQCSLILKNNHHDDDICLDHINRVNAVKMTINTDTANMVKNQWKGLDKPKPDEEFVDYQKRVDAFDKFDRTSRDVIDHIVIMDNEFHLTHRYDKRGRTYCVGYHANYQGNAWNKAVIEFADKELIAA